MEVSEISELTGMTEEAAQNLKLTAQNVLHAEEEAEGTKGQLESLNEISKQFMTELEEANVGHDVAQQAKTQVSEAIEGTNNLITEVNGVAQEAAKGGQELAKVTQEVGVLVQDIAELGQKGLEVPEKGINIASNVLGTVESVTKRINQEATKLEKS